jgi:hypothetical protein
MRRLSAIIGLQAYAFVLACAQAAGGVRTDEAKYLLNIPYPHPPLLRWVMSLTEACPLQDIFWRVVWATLFIQAVWFVWDIARSLPRASRLASCACWLLSAGIVLWAGSIYLSIFNALQALVLVWLLSRQTLANRHPVLTALFWTGMLFSGLQAVLYLPLMVTLTWKMRRSVVDVIVYALLPMGLLALYALSNPLVIAGIAHRGGVESAAPLMYKLYHTLRLWLIAGSGIVSILGVTGIIVSYRKELLASFVLVTLFLLLRWNEYNSVLFVPLLVMGAIIVLERWPRLARPLVAVLVPCCILFVMAFPFQGSPSPAGIVGHEFADGDVEGLVLINGDFGHEWQYALENDIRKFNPDLVDEAAAIVCLEACALSAGWERKVGWPVETWVRQ